MIEYKTGNIFEEEVEAIVNTVNCVGVMGRGIALQFKNAYPENFNAYSAACKNGEVCPGQMFVYKTNSVLNPRFIINFPTKRHWKENSRMGDIVSGLSALLEAIDQHGIRSIAIPPLGCGLGGLDWSEVRTRIEDSLCSLNGVKIVVFEPSSSPKPETMSRTDKLPKMTISRAALIGLMDRYQRGLLAPYMTLMELHKLMYFMQEAGEELSLKVKKHHYGPYAENLRHVLNQIEGHYIYGYADGGDVPDKQLQLAPNAVEEATAYLDQFPETLSRFEKVSDLVDGFESPFGLELLSTVHWVIKNESAASIDDIIERVRAWSPRKAELFSSRQVRIAADVMLSKGWVSSEAVVHRKTA